jgi:hypothetical protein
MLIELLDFFFKEKGDLELVLDIMNKHKVTNIGTTDPLKDSFFYVGKRYGLAFSRLGDKCGLYVHGDKVPLFLLTNEKEIDTLRQYIIGKCSVAVSS